MPSLVATREGLLLDLSMDAVWIHIESVCLNYSVGLVNASCIAFCFINFSF